MSGTIHAEIKETGQSTFAVEINVSGHVFTGDEPVDAGGKNLGPSPYDTLTAALGECTAMTVRWYAEQKKWPLERVEVKISHSKQTATEVVGATTASGEIDVFEKEVIVYGEDLTVEQREKLVEVAGKCPVQRTLQSEVIIRTKG